MYHDIEAVCNKIDVIKQKAELLKASALSQDSDITQFQIDDIRALCADIANDRGNEPDQ